MQERLDYVTLQAPADSPTWDAVVGQFSALTARYPDADLSVSICRRHAGRQSGRKGCPGSDGWALAPRSDALCVAADAPTSARRPLGRDGLVNLTAALAG